MNIHKSKRKSIKAATQWTEAYKAFRDAAEKFFPDEEAVEHAVDTLYRAHRNDPGYQEAYKRWCETLTDEDREEDQILYIIQDKNGKQLSAPNPDDSVLWDRVASMEARGRRGLSVVVYNKNYVGSSTMSFRDWQYRNNGVIDEEDYTDEQYNRDFEEYQTYLENLDEITPYYVKSVHDGRNQMTISVYSGISSDGFDVDIVDPSGQRLFSEQYRYGHNASYDRKSAQYAHQDAVNAKKHGWRSSYTEKPYVADIIDDLCKKYNIDKSEIQFAGGRNVFKQDDVSDATVSRFIQDYLYSSTDVYSNVTASEDFEDYEDEIQEIDQEFTSENTSINSGKLPAIFGLVHFEPGTINIDYGGGRFDNVAEYLTQYDVINLVYDPYNRSKEHNKEVLRTCKAAGGADTATCSNVLNVIKEPEVRKNVLENIKKIVKPTGTVYITVYEGSGKGNEGPTKSGYQLNRKTADYLQEIQEVFPDAARKGKLIVAHPSGSSAVASTSIKSSVDLSKYDSGFVELRDGEPSFVYDTYEDARRGMMQSMAGDVMYDLGTHDYKVARWENGQLEEIESSDLDSEESTVECALVDAPQDVIDELLDVLRSNGFILDPAFPTNPGRTWMGDVHIQVINTESHATTVEEVREYVTDELIDAIHAVEDKHDCPITWNFGANEAGQVTGGLDIMKKYVPDDEGPDIYSSSDIDSLEDTDDCEEDLSKEVITSSINDYPERPLDPPDYDDPTYEEDTCTVDLVLDTIITVDDEGYWDYEDTDWDFAKNSEFEDGYWYSDNEHVRSVDLQMAVETLDEFIEDRIPALPGRYRLHGKVTLVFDVDNIEVSYGYDRYEESYSRDIVDTESRDVDVTWNESESEIESLDVDPV